jgi:hypothetical protein
VSEEVFTNMEKINKVKECFTHCVEDSSYSG